MKRGVHTTPRFVTAPSKTLAECIRIRNRQRTTTTATAPTPSTSTSTTDTKKRPNLVADPSNAYLLTSARFGLTIEELHSAIRPLLAQHHPPLTVHIAFLPSGPPPGAIPEPASWVLLGLGLVACAGYGWRRP